MDFSLTDEQRIIQQTAVALFSKECPLAVVRAAWSDPHAASHLWLHHLREWVALSEGSLADVALFMQEYGRALVPGEFFATLLAAFAASTVETPLSGSATVAVAAANGHWTPNEDTVKHYVPSADQAEQVVVVSGSPQAPRIAVVAATQLEMTAVENMDQLRPLARVHTGSIDRGHTISPRAWEQVVYRALVTTAAELVGVGRYLLDSAVAYAQERQQFGRPIGSFQGLQWQLVNAALELERATAAVSWAAICVDADTAEAARAVHIAKLEAGSAARRCARTSLQVHGGIGYTWEQGLHFWLRRAYAGDAFMAPTDYHAACLAELLFAP